MPKALVCLWVNTMPSVLIEVRRDYSPDEGMALMDAVHDALIDAFQIKSNDRNVRLLVYVPERFACPPDKENPEQYTHISIDCFHGRSTSAKRKLYQTIISNLEKLDIPKDHVKILLREIPLENWGIRGGRAACDIELGFDVNV